MDKVALGQVFFENFDFPCYFSFHRPFHTHHLSSGAGKIGQLVAEVPSGLSLHPKKLKKNLSKLNRRRRQVFCAAVTNQKAVRTSK
jgi:hypothetical protein